MKKMICILLALLLFAVPVLTEGAPFGPYALTAPEGAVVEAGETSHTFVSGMTRVVTMCISRVPDANPAEAVIRMMTQFEPSAVIGEDVAAVEGFVALAAVNEDKFGEGIDMFTVMVLSAQGDLLILSAYDMAGDGASALALLDCLLETLAVDGECIIVNDK